MKRKFILLILFFWFCSGFSFPRHQGYINDYSNILSKQDKYQLEALSYELDQKTEVELVTVIVPTLQNKSIEEYANRLFEVWGIGKKNKDNGLLFLIAPNDKRIRIEIGYGLEGIISDGRAGEILDKYVIPNFRSGNLTQAIINGHIILAQEIAKYYNIQLSGGDYHIRQIQSNKSRTGLEALIPLVLLFLFLSLITRGKISPWVLLFLLSGSRGGGSFGGFGSGGFSGFGGGLSGGGGSSRSW